MNMDIEMLKQKIEKMSKQQQIEILRILKNKNSKLNENNMEYTSICLFT